MRAHVTGLLDAISALDGREREDLRAASDWVAGGAPLFRDGTPPSREQHLVCYFVPIDVRAGKLLLADHKKSGLWLPPGGHVEAGEAPRDTVIRECNEELGLTANFHAEAPLMLTVTRTVGGAPAHTDVSLWFALALDSSLPVNFDPGEFLAVRWFDWAAIPTRRAEPNLARFVAKLRSLLAHQGRVVADGPAVG